MIVLSKTVFIQFKNKTLKKIKDIAMELSIEECRYLFLDDAELPNVDRILFVISSHYKYVNPIFPEFPRAA